MKRAKSKADFFLIIQEELTKRFCPLTVSRLCAICGVSRSGYYRWVVTSHARLQREKKDEADFHLILEAYRFRGFDKGVQSIHMRLLRQKNSVRINVKKIRRLMRKFGLWCPIRQGNPYRQMAKALRTNAVADNHLKREFREHGPRAVLLTDITYIPYNSRFCYLSVIKDAYTKQILSYVLSASLAVDFVLETVKKLMINHGTELVQKTLIHSDQGCHYTSIAFRDLLKDEELRQSMSRRGNCWDNAPQESFLGI